LAAGFLACFLLERRLVARFLPKPRPRNSIVFIKYP
jgi:hypothetical protein